MLKIIYVRGVYLNRLVITGPLVYVMDVADRIVCKLCPFVAGGIFIGSVYWTAVTYGAVTVMQVGLSIEIIGNRLYCIQMFSNFYVLQLVHLVVSSRFKAASFFLFLCRHKAQAFC